MLNRRISATLLGFIIVLSGLILVGQSTNVTLVLAQGTQTPEILTAPITVDNIGQIELLSQSRQGMLLEVDWSPDGKSIAALTTAGLWLFDANSLQAPRFLAFPDGLLSSAKFPLFTSEMLAFVPNSNLIVVNPIFRYAGSVFLVDTDRMKIEYMLSTNHERTPYIAVSPDGALLAIAEGDKAQSPDIQLWDIHTQSRILTIDELPLSMLDVTAVFTPDGKTLVIGTKSQTFLWDVQTHQVSNGKPNTTLRIWDVMSADSTKIYSVFGGDAGRRDYWGIWVKEVGSSEAKVLIKGIPGTSIALKPDETQAVIGDQNSGVLAIWDIKTLQELKTYPFSKQITKAILSGDGQTVALIVNNVVEIYHTNDLEKPFFTIIDDPLAVATQVALNADSSRVAISSYGGKILDTRLLIYDTATKEQLVKRSKGVSSGFAVGPSMDSLKFTPDGNSLVVGYKGTSFQILDTATGQPQRNMPRIAKATGFDLSLDGEFLLDFSGQLQTIQVISVKTGQVVGKLNAKAKKMVFKEAWFGATDNTVQLLSNVGGQLFLQIWDTKLTKMLSEKTFRDTDHAIYGGAVSQAIYPNSDHTMGLAAMGSDGEYWYQWVNLITGDLGAKFKANDVNTLNVLFSPDKSRVIFVTDGLIRTFGIPTTSK
jgi:WD40 repeat protein